VYHSLSDLSYSYFPIPTVDLCKDKFLDLSMCIIHAMKAGVVSI
jgi:hypothetical protein